MAEALLIAEYARRRGFTMGRQKIQLDLEEVERLASLGLTEEQIGLALGVSQDTITRRKQDTADFADRLEGWRRLCSGWKRKPQPLPECWRT